MRDGFDEMHGGIATRAPSRELSRGLKTVPA
jgi:hypothetical protein